MRGFLHRTERHETNRVGLAHFFERPAHAHVTRQSLAPIGRPFKGGNGGGHWKAAHGSFSLLCINLRRTDRLRIDMSRDRICGELQASHCFALRASSCSKAASKASNSWLVIPTATFLATSLHCETA